MISSRQEYHTMSEISWYKQKHTLKIGDVCRYTIRYTKTDPALKEIYLRVKNMEKTGLRAIHFLNGPFMLYCHVTPHGYNQKKLFSPENSEGDGGESEVTFKNQIKPGQTFNVRLYLNNNSLVQENEDGSSVHQWECDIVSQIVLNRKVSILFVIMVGNDLEEMRRINRSTLTSLSKGDFKLGHNDLGQKHWGEVLRSGLEVKCQLTEDLWPAVPSKPKETPIHLVILTHGLFSNLTADMLYLRDKLYNLQSDNILVAGCKENAGRTEKGVHRLGVNVSVYVTGLIEELMEKGYKISHISFVAHSLGGPIQLYALKHILSTNGKGYFKDRKIALKNFVCLASPMLGILSEMSLLILWFLDLGTLGKTGRDLTLLKKLPSLTHGFSHLHAVRPILEVLPDEPIQTVLKDFDLLTIYANAVNDGIVPLRTSALLYLDWEGLGDVRLLKKDNSVNETEAEETEGNQEHNANEADEADEANEEVREDNPLILTNEAGPGVSEISDETNSNFADKYASFLARVFGLDADTTAASKKKKMTSKLKKYSKISAKSSDTNIKDQANENDDSLSGTEDEFDTLYIPPKASPVESAINSLICPIPSRRYVLEPKSRSHVIFHDKFYHHDSLPPEEPKNTGGLTKFFKYRDWRVDKQVRIARKYHAEGVTWRKILVCLPPDAHNNIVVRRRFANGYGWGVIDHLIENVFEKKMTAKL